MNIDTKLKFACKNIEDVWTNLKDVGHDKYIIIKLLLGTNLHINMTFEVLVSTGYFTYGNCFFVYTNAVIINLHIRLDKKI